MKNRFIAVFAASLVASPSCAKLQEPRFSSLQETSHRSVSTSEGRLELSGFIAGGSFSQNQREAVSSAGSVCESMLTDLRNYFGMFRFDFNRTSKNCSEPKNESPFGLGYLYVYRPKLELYVDPDDKIIEIDGPKIEGKEAKSHELHAAFSTFHAACSREILSAKDQFREQFVAASCGDAQSTIRQVYSPDHRSNVPFLTIRSTMKIFLREQTTVSALTGSLKISPNFTVSLPDNANAVVRAHAEYPAVLIPSFAGALTKVDLRTKKTVWQKNLTNPDPDSVRETTALNIVSASEDGSLLAVGADYGYLALLDGNSGMKKRLLSCDPSMMMPKHFVAAKIDQQHRMLYSAAILSNYPNHSTNYNRMIFPMTGAPVRTQSVEIVGWSLESAKENWTKVVELDQVLSLGISADFRLVYVVTALKILVMNALDGELIREYSVRQYEHHPAARFTGASFSPDMRLLAASGFSGIMLIEAETGKLHRRLRAAFKTEPGNAEILVEEDRIRAHTAYGQFFVWEFGSGTLLAEGENDKFTLNYNGPGNMPILSLENGRFLVKTSASFGGSGVSVPRIGEVNGHPNLCQVGADADLPDLRIRSLARLDVWEVE